MARLEILSIPGTQVLQPPLRILTVHVTVPCPSVTLYEIDVRCPHVTLCEIGRLTAFARLPGLSAGCVFSFQLRKRR